MGRWRDREPRPQSQRRSSKASACIASDVSGHFRNTQRVWISFIQEACSRKPTSHDRIDHPVDEEVNYFCPHFNESLELSHCSFLYSAVANGWVVPIASGTIRGVLPTSTLPEPPSLGCREAKWGASPARRALAVTSRVVRGERRDPHFGVRSASSLVARAAWRCATSGCTNKVDRSNSRTISSHWQHLACGGLVILHPHLLRGLKLSHCISSHVQGFDSL
jgi:hypothetical protein